MRSGADENEVPPGNDNYDPPSGDNDNERRSGTGKNQDLCSEDDNQLRSGNDEFRPEDSECTEEELGHGVDKSSHNVSEEGSGIIYAKDEREVQAHLSKGAVDIISPHIQQEVSVQTPNPCLEASDEVKRLRSNVEEVDVNISQQERDVREQEKQIREDMSRFDELKQMEERIEKMCKRLKEINDQRKAIQHFCSNTLESMITVRSHAEAVANAKLLARLLPKDSLWCRTDVARGLYYELDGVHGWPF